MSLLGAMEYVKDTSSLCMQRSNSNVNIHLIYYVKWSTFRKYILHFMQRWISNLILRQSHLCWYFCCIQNYFQHSLFTVTIIKKELNFFILINRYNIKWSFIHPYIKCHFSQFWFYLKLEFYGHKIYLENFAARKSPRKLNFKDPFFYQTSFGFWIGTELWMNVCKKGKRNMNILELCFILNLLYCNTWK